MKKYLITTADEATWKFDKKVVFLGNGAVYIIENIFGKKWILTLQNLTA